MPLVMTARLAGSLRCHLTAASDIQQYRGMLLLQNVESKKLVQGSIGIRTDMHGKKAGMQTDVHVQCDRPYTVALCALLCHQLCAFRCGSDCH